MKTVIFIHRSVGHNLVHDGGVYDLARNSSPAFDFSDYDQNIDLLTDKSGSQQKMGFTFPGGNTRPVDFAAIFTDAVAPEHKAIQDLALGYDVIVLKSCYPNSNIASDNELENIKQYYRSIAQFFSTLTDKQLVLLTSPPLAPIMTKAPAARRARQLSEWLATTKLGSNVSVFNFFDLLATPKGQRGANRLRKGYRRWLPFDSHPNPKASKEIAPKFVEYISKLA